MSITIQYIEESYSTITGSMQEDPTHTRSIKAYMQRALQEALHKGTRAQAGHHKPSGHLSDAWHECGPLDTLTRATTTPSNLPVHDRQLRHHLLLPHYLRPPPQRLSDPPHALDILPLVPMMAGREQHRILGGA